MFLTSFSILLLKKEKKCKESLKLVRLARYYKRREKTCCAQHSLFLTVRSEGQLEGKELSTPRKDLGGSKLGILSFLPFSLHALSFGGMEGTGRSV